MSLFQPSNIVPDVRNGLGFGTIDADRTWEVSWRVNGSNAMTAFAVSIFTNDETGSFLYSTGRITDGCPFYGTAPNGEERTFRYTMPAVAALDNGYEYKLLITQWWGEEESVEQNSASVFYCRALPSLMIDPIGTNGVIDNKEYTFTGTYTQAQGDVLNWFRWRIANAEDLTDPLYDSGCISGTMDMRCHFDGLFTGQPYAVRLEIQTQNGVATGTGWVKFSVDYGEPMPSPDLTAECADGTNAVLVKWGDANGLITPTQDGALTYSGDAQSPVWADYNPAKIAIGGVTTAVNAGTYTTTFTPKDGYAWGIGVPGATDWGIYRKDANGGFIHLADVPAERGELYDYGAGSRQGPFVYYVFPLQRSADGSSTVLSPPVFSNAISPCYASWSLMESAENADGSYTVMTEYLFRYNFASSAMSNNNKPKIEQNFTRYPTYFPAPQNYKSGSLTSLIGVVDYQNNARYSDTLSMRDRMFALSTTRNRLFLKSRKGDVLYIALSEPVTAATADDTFEQTQTISVSWVEIGENGNLLKLTAAGNVTAGDGDVLSPELTLDPAFVALNVGDTFTVKATWKGGGALSVSTPDNLTAGVNGDEITVTALRSGKTSIDVSVSASGQYAAQTAALTVDAVGGVAIPVPYTDSVLTYNGTAQNPVWRNFDGNLMTIGGDLSAIDGGMYSTTFTPKPGYMWNDGTFGAKSVPWVIGKATPYLTVTPSPISVAAGGTQDFDVDTDSDGDISAVSENPNVATVVINTGAVPVQPPAQSGSLRYNGNTQSPTWSGFDQSIMTLSGQTSGTTPGVYDAVFTLDDGYIWAGSAGDADGTVNGVSAGSTTVTVSTAETGNYHPASVTVTVNVG